ncbi:hypothetical protein [Paenibacillus apiarius]|uniref:Uncharacterized protein n=1 Tax=Paenibacillus apiarius TaxID=46240 RepID=A0ABT4DUY7_9BACL|nr:hypothetical protein [Paenibacillus apiarius]MCY9513440.1 hypothetical protein [Paenibacillus apiarius]MCY9521167.1 hypothetical protein [Paenibacillus apiarius]MCY9553356.1 hypothetical protein [Paenibacillus apiarius]MCY9559610.1 hypothetical protein [Paenibacillus apiarius]MCY9685384.1 hypothetical protein [Paenibacillus apiarius]
MVKKRNKIVAETTNDAVNNGIEIGADAANDGIETVADAVQDAVQTVGEMTKATVDRTVKSANNLVNPSLDEDIQDRTLQK